ASVNVLPLLTFPLFPANLLTAQLCPRACQLKGGRMRYVTTFLGTVCLVAPRFAQQTIDSATQASRKYHVSSYSDHEPFIGHPGYGAPLILTQDGGAAAFGSGDDGAMLYKFDERGELAWKRELPVKGKEMELQSVVQTPAG